MAIALNACKKCPFACPYCGVMEIDRFDVLDGAGRTFCQCKKCGGKFEETYTYKETHYNKEWAKGKEYSTYLP